MLHVSFRKLQFLQHIRRTQQRQKQQEKKKKMKNVVVY